MKGCKPRWERTAHISHRHRPFYSSPTELKKKGKRCGLLFPCNTNNNKKKKKAATRHRREHTLHAKALYGWQIKKDHLFATKSEFSSAAVYQTSWGKSWRKQALWSYLEPDILFWISVHFFFWMSEHRCVSCRCLIRLLFGIKCFYRVSPRNILIANTMCGCP